MNEDFLKLKVYDIEDDKIYNFKGIDLEGNYLFKEPVVYFRDPNNPDVVLLNTLDKVRIFKDSENV